MRAFSRGRLNPRGPVNLDVMLANAVRRIDKDHRDRTTGNIPTARILARAVADAAIRLSQLARIPDHPIANPLPCRRRFDQRLHLTATLRTLRRPNNRLCLYP